jgi:hypothetical protein
MKKISLIALALILALGTLGVAYAMWWDTVTIGGTVVTDDVEVEWKLARNYDTGLDPDYPDGLKDKDVGSTTITGLDSNTLTLVIDNGYPSYYNDIECEFENTGSVPVIIDSVVITPTGFTVASDYGADDGEVWIRWVNGEGTQLEPGERSASSLHIHVEQCAAQGATYTFTIQILCVQWNEYTP